MLFRSAYTIKNIVAAPVANVATGTDVAQGSAITLATATSGAVIYYNINAAGWVVYTAPVVLNTLGSVDLQAKAVKPGMEDSLVFSATYEVTAAAAAPTSSVATGTQVAPGSSVTLSTATATATIYYTVDGSTPTALSTEYTAAIAINGAVTIKAIAIDPVLFDSSVATFAYTVSTVNPIVPNVTFHLNASVSGTVGMDNTVLISGSLTEVGRGALTADRTLVIQHKAVGAANWSNLVTVNLVSGSLGQFNVSYKFLAAGNYRLAVVHNNVVVEQPLGTRSEERRVGKECR